MKILKFGGKSLALPHGLDTVSAIVEKRYKTNPNFHIVVSACGCTTNDLEALLEQAAQGKDYVVPLLQFKNHYLTHSKADLSVPFTLLDNLLAGVALLVITVPNTRT